MDMVGNKYTKSIWWSEAKFLVIHTWIDQKAVLISFHDLSLSFVFSKPVHLKALYRFTFREQEGEGQGLVGLAHDLIFNPGRLFPSSGLSRA